MMFKPVPCMIRCSVLAPLYVGKSTLFLRLKLSRTSRSSAESSSTGLFTGTLKSPRMMLSQFIPMWDFIRSANSPENAITLVFGGLYITVSTIDLLPIATLKPADSTFTNACCVNDLTWYMSLLITTMPPPVLSFLGTLSALCPLGHIWCTVKLSSSLIQVSVKIHTSSLYILCFVDHQPTVDKCTECFDCFSNGPFITFVNRPDVGGYHQMQFPMCT